MAPDADPALPFVATHRVTAEEAAVGEAALHPDLEVLELLDTATPALAGGGDGFMDHDRPGDTCVLTGPRHWMGTGAAGGDLLAFTWDGRGLGVSRVDPGAVGDGAALAEALRAGLDRDRDQVAAGDGVGAGTAPLAALLREALARDPELLAEPVRPVSAVLGELGLEYHGGWVGPVGTDWPPLDEAVRQRNQLVMSAVGHGLTRPGFDALQTLVAALEAEAAGEEGRTPADVVGTALAAEEGVAPALAAAAAAAAAADGTTAAALASLADRATAAMRGRQKAPALWLAASCAEARGDHAAQESLLGQAIGSHPDYRPALLDMSWYASDHGQAGRAASLLGSAGVPADDPWRRRLEHYARPGPHHGPRNEPCKCGSGRKAKSCCLATNGWPLVARLPWLYDKAVAFLSRTSQQPVLDAVLDAWTEGAEGHADRQSLDDDPLPADLALFEGGVLARFVQERGPLLPADEAALAARWTGAPLRLCEVAEVRADEGLVLDDLLSGERLEVVERSATHSLIPHLLVLVRVLPDGQDGLQLFGSIRPVAFGRHEGLLEVLASEPDAAAVAAWLGRASLPPTFTDAEGEPQVVGRAVLELAPDMAPEEAAAALAGALEAREEDGGWVLTGPGEGEGEDGRAVQGRVTPAGRRLVVEASSERRLDEAVAAVRAAVGGLTVVDSVALPLDAGLLRRLMAGLAAPPAGGEGEPGPEAQELLARKLREYEEAWVDEPIPALGGATPRAAVDDERLRRDLERLLADMELRSAGMDAGRIRSLLGLAR